MSVHVKGFGCRPLERRRRLFGGPRPKASKRENPRSYLSRNCFELLVKSITAFVMCLHRDPDWMQLARRPTIVLENARVRVGLLQAQCLVLGHELADHYVFDHARATR